MNTEALIKLKKRIEKNPLEDEDDLLLFIQLASRMKALGDSSEFDKIPEIINRKEFNGKLDAILEERCRRGIWDVENQTGEEQGLSIIEAQDFWCFYNYAKDTGLFSKKSEFWFEEWSHETYLASINEKTADTIRSFTMTYPIPEEDMLAVVVAPVTEFEYKLIDRLAASVPIHRAKGTWTRPDISYAGHPAANFAEASVVVAACDDGEPSEALLLSQNHLFTEVQTLHGSLRIQRFLNQNWQLVLEMEDSQGNVPKADRVRIGVLPFQWNEEGKEWVLDLKPHYLNFRLAALNNPTVIRLSPIDIVEIVF